MRPEIKFGGEPPQGKHQARGFLVSVETAALSRPGEWLSFESSGQSNANVQAKRLRQLGLEVRRVYGTPTVWVRAPAGGAP